MLARQHPHRHPHPGPPDGGGAVQKCSALTITHLALAKSIKEGYVRKHPGRQSREALVVEAHHHLDGHRRQSRDQQLRHLLPDVRNLDRRHRLLVHLIRDNTIHLALFQRNATTHYINKGNTKELIM
ncbi:uncharacterized protein G2W53_008716 [Senna tora]|uniref:Uncharacterized protein n=1 Tax=Senna tora TaxID=362788 RepID=A0A834X8M5_9FABA|nr:uncharacterized protein G2W53_008716 [Senna tora]